MKEKVLVFLAERNLWVLPEAPNSVRCCTTIFTFIRDGYKFPEGGSHLSWVQWAHTERAEKPGSASRILPPAGLQASFFPLSTSPRTRRSESTATHGALSSGSAPSTHSHGAPPAGDGGDEGKPLCAPKRAPKDTGCSFSHSLPYRAAFRPL